MPETKKSKLLTVNQLESILKTDHIREHLIKAGFINDRGDIISDRRLKRRLSRRHTSTMYPRHHITYISQSTVRSIYTGSRQPNREKKESDRLQPSYCSPTRQRLKSASTVQSRQTNTAAASTPLSSSSKSTFIENVLIRRAVSPKILFADERCIVVMKYFGEMISVDFNRTLFIPQDDQIILMQQHCGGENIIVFKGYLKANDEFSFESRRHTDYPFALAFYVNGVVVDRLSICCEHRFKSETQIGGRTGLFSIQSIEKARPCRKCRFEHRMAKILKERPELRPRNNRYDNSSRQPIENEQPNSLPMIKSRLNSSDITTSDVPSSKPTTADKKNSKKIESSTSHSKPSEFDDEGSKTSGSFISDTKSFESDDEGSKASVSPPPNPKPVKVDDDDSKTSAPPASQPKPLESDNNDSKASGSPVSQPKPREFFNEESTTSGPPASQPKSLEFDDEDAKSSESLTSSVTEINQPQMIAQEKNESPKPISSDEENSTTRKPLASSSKANESGVNIPTIPDGSPLSSAKINKSDSDDDSDEDSDTVEPDKKNRLKANAPRVSSPESVDSDTLGSEDRHEKPTSRPISAPVNQFQTSNRLNPLADSADFDETYEDINSSISSSREDDVLKQQPPSNTRINRKKKTNDLDRSETSDDEDSSTDG